MSEAIKLYPLAASQKMHYYTVQYCPKKEVLNIGTSLTIETDINFDVLKELITNYVDVDAEEITEDSKFIDDLGFNSYDFMSFLGEIEDEFDVEIDEREAIKIHTVGEAVDYIESISE